MITRRARLIAAQTLVTVILMAVVAATLLSPDSDNPQLFGVEVPGTSPPVAQGPPIYEPEGVGAGDGRGGPNGSGAGGSGAGGAGGATSVPPASGGEATTPLTRPPGAPGAVGGPEAPTDDQYADTLARLSQSVN